ncbi:MAG: glycogen/starch/alpha-glucan phosphorylase [Cyclobacteriaceae bacterium]
MEPRKKPTIKIEDDRTGTDIETFKRAFLDNLFYVQGKSVHTATKNDLYFALSYTIRDRILHRWLSTQNHYWEKNVRVIGYLSAEYLVGPHLTNNLINTGFYDNVNQAMQDLGVDLNVLIEQEEEPGLGNGGLGRLAACFLDSMATLDIPAIGYGIRYEFGIFDQEIQDGWQLEITDKWLRYGNPWEICKAENSVEVFFGGHTKKENNKNGELKIHWEPEEIVRGIPYDTPILGFQTNTAATLRLWKSDSEMSFDLSSFNRGDYYGAVDKKINSENISKVLYPSDDDRVGKELRLKQQYFFVSCSLQDAIRIHINRGNPIETFHEKFTLQLNDTHPAVGIPELMRLLVDIHELNWEKAWEITTSSFGYTNHTLLPEALEKWSIDLFQQLLPRLMEIIFEINHRFMQEVKEKVDKDTLARLSIIEESNGKYVRMANLASYSSHSINGVAELHTELLKKSVLKDFHDLWPTKFNNKTNGVTPRRWMLLINPRLSNLIDDTIGNAWQNNLTELKNLEAYTEDPNFLIAWQKCKSDAKQRLSDYVKDHLGIALNPDSLFDVQAKRIHEYKRQHLNVLHIIHLYNQIKENPSIDIVPRTFIFSGKAAPSYHMAKLIIKLINNVADVVNHDPDVKDLLKVVFLPDFNVSKAQRIYPAADLSEQISTAGKEASGTGNMKFTMNGALTIGTLDGANVEIMQEVGKENFFLFGHTVEENQEILAKGYRPTDVYQSDPDLKKCLDMLSLGYFSKSQKDLFRPLVDHLLNIDNYLVLADFRSYIEQQKLVSEAFLNFEHWSSMSVINTANTGKFSSDRTIKQYCEEIWHIDPVPIEIPPYNPVQATNLKIDVKP